MVYLFGTVHILRKDEAWESPEITNAFAASSELWLEVPNADDVQAAQALIKELGFDPQHPLSTKLSPRDLAHVDATTKSVGMTRGEQALEPMQPWLAALAISETAVAHAGYDPASGVEHVLQQEAVAAHKPVRGFETLEHQMHLFADMSPPLQIDVLEDALSDSDAGPAKLDALVDAWSKGDQPRITQLIVDELKTPFPTLYQTLLVARNAAWAGVIADMLKQPGTRFIAVGAAHLAGSDSVLVKLEQRGIHVERVGPSS